jgi:glutathione S-transferase
MTKTDGERARAHVAALKHGERGRRRSLRASALARLRLPDGAPLSADLAIWLAFDASSVPLLRGMTTPTWALASAEPVRAWLPAVELPRDAPLVALEPAASYERFLALFPSRGNPVLAWDGAELWVERPTFVDYLEATFPAALDGKPDRSRATRARADATTKAVGRLPELAPAEIDALATGDLATLARGLGEKVNAKLLKATRYLAAVVRALARHGLFREGYEVLRAHSAAWRGGLAGSVLVPALELASASKDDELRRFVLAEYRACAKRDPGDLYYLGDAHVLALRCVESADEHEALLDVVEHVLLHAGDVPDSVPVAAPELARLWVRPSMKAFAREIAPRSTKRSKPSPSSAAKSTAARSSKARR